MSVEVAVKLVITQTTCSQWTLVSKAQSHLWFLPSTPVFESPLALQDRVTGGGEVRISLNKMGQTFKIVVGHQLSPMPFNVNRQYRTFLMATLIKA